MLDHFGGGERAHTGGGAVILAVRMSDQESGGEQVAGAGDIDHFFNRHGLHRLDAVAGDHDAAFFAARYHRELGVGAQELHGGIEIGGFVQAVQFALIGEQDIDRALADQIEKLGPKPLDAECVRQSERDAPPVTMARFPKP